jgi:glycosyltransferase involved in cell wall biosynthesis
MSLRLAIVVSHPIQYYSPWFRDLASRTELQLKVFYLWDFGITEKRDPVFGTSFKWDVPLMEGYESTFVPNVSKDPGTHHFKGLDNPGLVDAISEWKPDAIMLIGYNFKSLLRLIFSRRLRNVPILFRGDSHELAPAIGWSTKIKRFLRRLIFRRFDRVLAVGIASVGYFLSSGMPKERIRIVPHCIDNDRFQSAANEAAREALLWRREMGISESSLVILFAGKLDDVKRPQDLLAVFQNLLGYGAVGDAVLLMVGSGPLEAELKAIAGEHLGRNVFFAPFQNQSAMPRVYAAGDVLVLPSRSETWGLAVNEAMNLGIPAIVSSHVGCGPDLIREGETGWIFKAGDQSDLERVLMDALSDPERLRKMGENAKELISGFSYQAASQGVVDAVKKVVGGG